MGEERRRDSVLRRQIKELLALIREFYTTCHMVAVGQLEPSKAKAKARVVEDKLRAMMAETIERLEESSDADEETGGDGGSGDRDENGNAVGGTGDSGSERRTP